MRGWGIALAAGAFALSGCAAPERDAAYPALKAEKPYENIPALRSALRTSGETTPLEEALEGAIFPPDIRKALALVEVEYWGFDEKPHAGRLVVQRELAEEVRAIFAELRQKRFPVQSITPIAIYGWSDEKSMQENNTSGFNYRNVPGTERLSNHATGRAIDVNPKINPYFRNGASYPPNTQYDPTRKGAITPEIAQTFEKRGWNWGGRWREKDWQHFDKTALAKNKDDGRPPSP